MTPTLAVGDTRELTLVDGLTRTRLVQYAGASGDYNPVHTDEVYATTVAGQPTVFGHGMLTMGMTGRVLTDWFGVEHLAAYEARFVAQVWPGDTLVARAEVVAIEEHDGKRVAQLTVSTVNGHGELVLRGSATAHLS